MYNIKSQTHTYAQYGFYKAGLCVYNTCGVDSVCKDIDLTIVGVQTLNNKTITARLANGFLLTQGKVINSFNLYDIAGNQLQSEIVNTNSLEIDFSANPKGYYVLELFSGQ
jgi:PKD repeat protein